jgi:hypothetical protein
MNALETRRRAFVRLRWQENRRRGGHLSSWAVLTRLRFWWASWSTDPAAIKIPANPHNPPFTQPLDGVAPVAVYEVERDRHGITYSGPLEVGECVRVSLADAGSTALDLLDEFDRYGCHPDYGGVALP